MAYTLPNVSDLYGQVQQQLQGYGNAQQAALNQSYQNAMGMGMQSLASSGLAGTSIAPSMRMGYMKQYQLALNNLNQQRTQTRLGAQSTFGLGGIGLQNQQQQLAQSQQQISNQMALGLGNLNVNQQYANIAQQHQQQQNVQQRQQLAYQSERVQPRYYSPYGYSSGSFT